MIRKTQFAVAIAALISAPAFAAVGFDANVELDTKYQNMGRGASQSGRVELNAYSKSDKGGGFVAGRASYMAGKGGAASVDDMWVQIGNASGDIKLGRFEAADAFPLGKDVLVEDGGSAGGYRTNVFRGRNQSATIVGDTDPTSYGNVAHVALNVNAGSGVGFELGIQADKKNVGVRPVVSFGMNGFTAKVALENGKNGAGQKVSGAGVTVGTTMAGAGLNVNFGSGKVNGVKGSSFGVNATFGPAGLGYILDKNGSNKDSVVYAAYSLPLFDTGATITPAASYAKGTGKEKQIGLAARINYAF